MKTDYEALIIGCGPAGMGAALELKNAGVDFAIIEKDAPGGKVNIAPRVDNYPGQHEIPGPDLAMVLFQRILDNKIEMISDEVTSLTKDGDLFTLIGKYATYHAKTVLIATGTKERKLGFENEDRLLGHGLSYCALCDGHFFKDKVVAVVGGGNVALKESIHLAGLVKKLYLIHRRNEFRGDRKLVDKIKEMDKIEIVTPYIPLEILDNGRVTGLKIQNREDGSEKVLDIDGIFPLIGQDPNSEFIKIDGVKNEWGTIPFNKGMVTSVEGLYVAGDVTPRDIRQIYLAEHDGKVAAKSMIEFLGK
ncbi:MAG: FAD-dependent oxidoreductase [Bacilli bacterium]|nr:FAD-dependent oxidoreductase [Bacilli bacterium]